jgi:hypothetical protein
VLDPLGGPARGRDARRPLPEGRRALADAYPSGDSVGTLTLPFASVTTAAPRLGV